LALRDQLREYAADAVTVLGERRLVASEGAERRHEVLLSAGGDRFRAVLAESEAAEPRPESCGKSFGTPLELRLVSLEKDD